MPIINIEHTEQQLEAIDLAVEGFRQGCPLRVIGGYAGTGKTTSIKEIIQRVHNLQVVTFTGKASSVLRNRGVNSQTIHSTIYEWDPDCDEFFLKESIGCDGFIIDEASMVGKDLYNDLESFGLPILAVGDPGQLEPIGDSSISLMDSPDIVLEEIHRQAKGSEIIKLATRIRKNGAHGLKLQEKPGCCIRSSKELQDQLSWPDIILCGYNKTRQEINKIRRKSLHYRNTIEVGDKLICVQNDKKLGVFNGMILVVLKIHSTGRTYDCTIKTDNDQIRRLRFWTMGLEQPDKLTNWSYTRSLRGEKVIADYAQGITVHKSQGSEWDKVSVVNQFAKWDQTRWLYTAVTRGARELRLYV